GKHGDPLPSQIGSQRRQPISLILGPAVFDRHVLALDEARLLQAPGEKTAQVRKRVRRLAVEEPDHRHRRLLPSRRDRACGRCAGEQRDELAAFHVWMAPDWQEITSRAAQKSLAVMCPACSRSPDGLLALMGCANRGLITRTGSMSR